MSKRDYYEVLGVSKSATDDEIKKSFRRLAMKHHPDRNPDDKSAEEKFKEAREAYEALSDRSRRAQYDQFGHQSQQGGFGGGGFGGFGGAGGGADIFGDFGDIFGNIFGGGQHKGGPARGSDLRYNLEITLAEAVHGKTIELTIPTQVACEECKGSGARKGSKPATCKDCAGHGQVRIQQGFFSVQQTCPACHGRGQVILEPCAACHGRGRTKKSKKLSVKIPAGVDTGDRIRLSSEGEAGESGAASGDLYVQVTVKPHELFGREGTHLHCEVPISFMVATLGGEVEVPTLSGHIKLKIPAETQSSKVFRLKGMGVPPVHGGSRGDLMCKVVVETPVNLTAKQKELIQELGLTLSKDNKHNPKSDSWLKRAKKFFDEIKGTI